MLVQIKNTFQDYHDNPLHFLCICLLDKGRKNQSLLSPVTIVCNTRITSSKNNIKKGEASC